MVETTNDVVVQSWGELCERLYDDCWQGEIGRYRSNYAFRGVSDTNYNLANRFMRLCGHNVKLEYHLLRNFRKYAHHSSHSSEQSDWRWLTVAQHHGLPTRLLDWTYSPFVALHFATANVQKYDCDGAIWCVDFVEVNRLVPSPLIDVLNEIGSNTFTLEMLERALPDVQSFGRNTREDLLIFFEPPSLDARIVNQFAFFSLMSDPSVPQNGFLKNHPNLFRRIIIPKELKWEVRDKVDQANITERILFPGLDGLADWLTRHYSPRDPGQIVSD